MKSLLFLLIASLLFVSCGHYVDEPTKSVWGGGLWIIPWIAGIGAARLLWIAYKKSKSGIERQKPGGGYDTLSGNLPIYKFGQFWFAVVIVIGIIVMIISVNANK